MYRVNIYGGLLIFGHLSMGEILVPSQIVDMLICNLTASVLKMATPRTNQKIMGKPLTFPKPPFPYLLNSSSPFSSPSSPCPSPSLHPPLSLPPPAPPSLSSSPLIKRLTLLVPTMRPFTSAYSLPCSGLKCTIHISQLQVPLILPWAVTQGHICFVDADEARICLTMCMPLQTDTSLTRAKYGAIEGNVHAYMYHIQAWIDARHRHSEIKNSNTFQLQTIWKVGKTFHKVGAFVNVMMKDDKELSSI